MKIVDPGHIYLLTVLDDEIRPPRYPWGLELVFVKREGEPQYPGNIGRHPGTTTQEVLRALIERSKYVNNQIPDPRNDQVLINLRDAMAHLELRAAERHGRILNIRDLVEGPIESLPTCSKCNHIGCPGTCRP